MIRPKLLLSVAFALLGLTSPATGQPPAQAESGYLQSIEPVAPGVHVIRQRAPAFAGVIGNVTVIEQSDGLVLVDAGVSHGNGERIVQMIRSVSAKPVKAVVVTHWHFDHYLGLSAILAAWPNADVIAQEAAAADMDARNPTLPRAASAEWEAERIRSLTEAYESIRTDQMAAAQTPEERAGWADIMANLPYRVEEARGSHLILPRRTYRDRLILPDANAPVEVSHAGRAHTTGDSIVWLPRQRVLVAGDIVGSPVPFMLQIYPSDMLTVFDRMRALQPAVVIPGHGAPLQGTAYLESLGAYVRDVQRQVTPLARVNVPLEEVAGRTDFAAQQRVFTSGNPWLGYWFGIYSLNPLIQSVYREARGEPLGPDPVQ